MSINVPVDFDAKFDKLLSEFEKFNKRVEKNVDLTAEKMGKLELAAKAFVAGFTVKKIVDGLQLVTEKGVESEEAVRKLTTALIATDSATDRNVKAFTALADELARTSRFDDELILSQVAIAKQFGVTNKEAAKLLRVASDLASATDGDLNSAVRNLGMTLDGTAGRMAQQFPILQRLTAEQLRNGAAIELLGKQYAGAGLRSLEGFKGQSIQVGKAMDNLAESIGLIIVQNPEVISSLTKTAESLVKMTEIVARNSEAISGWISQVIRWVGLAKDVFGSLISNGDDIYEVFRKYNAESAKSVEITDLFAGAMDKLVKRFDPITGKFVEFTSNTKEGTKAIGAFNAVTGQMGDAFDESKQKFDRFAGETRKQLEELEKKLQNVGKTEIETLTNEYKRNQDLLFNAKMNGYIKEQAFVKTLGQLEMKYAQDVAKFKEEAAKKAEELAKKNYSEMVARIQQAYSAPIQSMVDQRYGEQNPGRLSSSNQQNLGQVAGIARNMLGGREGARQLLSEGVGAVASIWLGPFGKIIGDLVGELSKGPEHVKKMMTEFFDSMPELIENLILAVDEAMITFLEKWPEFLERMLDRLPEIVDRLIENLPRLMEAVVKYVVKIGELFLVGILKMIWKLIEGAGRFVGKILEGAGKFIEKIIQGAGRFIEELVKGIGKAVSKSFGGGGINLGGGSNFDWTGGWGDGDVTSIATGGLSDVFGWKAQGKGGAQPMVVQLQIGGKQLAQAIVDLKQMGHKI